MIHTCRPGRMEDSPIPRRILAGSMRTCVHWLTLIKFNIVNLKQVVAPFTYLFIGRLHTRALAKSLRVMPSAARCHVSMWFFIGDLAESARSRRGVGAESARSRRTEAYFLWDRMAESRLRRGVTAESWQPVMRASNPATRWSRLQKFAHACGWPWSSAIPTRRRWRHRRMPELKRSCGASARWPDIEPPTHAPQNSVTSQ